MQQKSDNVVSHYVFEAPVRIWHWLTVLCMAVLMVTGYFIGKPLPSVSGEATYLFYMGYIRLIHFSAGMVFTVVLLVRIYWAFVGNRYSRELFIVPVWRKSWWQGVWYEIRWYLFSGKTSECRYSHNPIARRRCSAIPDVGLSDHHWFVTFVNTASTLFLRRSVMWWNFSTGRVATQWTFTAGIGWGCG